MQMKPTTPIISRSCIQAAAWCPRRSRWPSATPEAGAAARGHLGLRRLRAHFKTLGIEHFRSAGHSTHSFGGTFGAAAAAGALAGLDAGRRVTCCRLPRNRHRAFVLGARCRTCREGFRFRRHARAQWRHGGSDGVGRFIGVEDVFSGDRNFFMLSNFMRRPTESRAGWDAIRHHADRNQALARRLPDPGAAGCAGQFDGAAWITAEDVAQGA